MREEVRAPLRTAEAAMAETPAARPTSTNVAARGILTGRLDGMECKEADWKNGEASV